MPATATSSALRPTRIRSLRAGLEAGAEQDKDRTNFRDRMDGVTGIDPAQGKRA
jgi:hypothetical protein